MKFKEKMSHFKTGWGENVVNGFMSLFGRDGRIVSIRVAFLVQLLVCVFSLQSEFFHGKKEMIKRVFSPGHPSPDDDEMMVDSEGEASGAVEAEGGEASGTGEVSPTSSGSFPPSPGPLLNLDDFVAS